MRDFAHPLATEGRWLKHLPRLEWERDMNVRILIILVVMIAMPNFAQEQISSDGVPVHMVVTVEATHGKEIPQLQREDVIVLQGKDRLRLTEWTTLQGEQAGLELFVLVDDASADSLGVQLADVREFINAQPASTSIGIGYMRDDVTAIVQNLTTDHTLAAKSLRLPLGRISVGASPYLALSNLIKKWPRSAVRREVLMISSGVDLLGEFGPTNPYLDAAIEQAQRAGMIVYAIYAPSAGHSGHSFWRMNWGQNFLGELAEETGGEAYMLGFGPPVSLAPYLREVAESLNHQYSATFVAKPPAKPGWVSVRYTTEVPNAEIVAPRKVWVSKPPLSGKDH